MTVDLSGSTGASSGQSTAWESLAWDFLRASVKRLQMRIAKAIRANDHGRARALQWMLTHSRAAKLLAVHRVSSNKGHATPGVDGQVWRNDSQKFAAVLRLKQRGYHAARTQLHSASMHWPRVTRRSGFWKVTTAIPQKMKKCWLDVLNLPHGRGEKQKNHQTNTLPV
ncbi:MAG TPA: reverse transcriptase N-terminal domain-containing protein [Terriglobales bacterium]|nr:reverse transcriptase N-terminal domain-containing protein [Terriglobales bacterium]